MLCLEHAAVVCRYVLTCLTEAERTKTHQQYAASHKEPAAGPTSYISVLTLLELMATQ
jgi:hypothetical protein